MAGDDDDRRRAGGAQALQHGHAVDAGKPEVEDDHVEFFARELRDGRLARFAERGLVPLVVKDVRQRGADCCFVVDDDYFCHDG